MIRKYLCLFLVSVLILISIAGVSAIDNDTQILNENNNIEVSNNFSDGNFDELSQLINNTPENGELILNKNYNYINGSNKGISILKTITIDGSNHTINGNHLSRIFNITADNVVLKNINFINGNSFGSYFSRDVGGGAIYWNGNQGLVENCNFTNNAGSGIKENEFYEQTIVNEDGSVVQQYYMMPMGAKTNEGGAIVWNGKNGCVSKCIFKNNDVGYPNSGGAICWRGNFGKIMNCEFYNNSAWCGSAIAWIGDNGAIFSSVITNSSLFDGGIYWFGKNGTIKNSILLSCSARLVLRPSDADVNADCNFWGDTLNNHITKIDNVNNWFVVTFTHNGEFVKTNQKVSIKYYVNSLVDKTGKVSKCEGIINYSGEFSYTAPKYGFLKVTIKNGKIHVIVDSKDKIKSKNLVKYYSKVILYKVGVSDVLGKVIGKTVKFKVNKKIYRVKTNKKGVAILKLKLKPGKYIIYSSYGAAKVKNKITIKKTLITKNLSKKVTKSVKFKVKVLNSKGKAYPKQLVKIKFKGKTYKLKTNGKGIASFDIFKNLKLGKYTIKTSCNGLVNSNKIFVKK